MFCVDVTGIIADRNNSVQTIKKAVHQQIQLLAARSLFPISVHVKSCLTKTYEFLNIDIFSKKKLEISSTFSKACVESVMVIFEHVLRTALML